MMQTDSLFQPSGKAAAAPAPCEQTWKCGPKEPAIWPNEVHVWRARLDVAWSWTMDEALTLEDRARADRFRFESDRRRFCVARSSLRTILGRYLKTKPGRLQIESGEYGKPLFQNRNATLGLRFNLSHSHQLALIAITRDREVGVDVEYIRGDFVTDEVAGHFFSAGEVKQLRSVPDELKTRAFFDCWTRKEAYIKARGEGIYCPLDQFEVSLVPGERPRLLESRVESGESERWSFEELRPGAGYAATVAVEGQSSRLVLWDLM